MLSVEFFTGSSSSLLQVVMAHTDATSLSREKRKKRCEVNDLSPLVHVYVGENGCEQNTTQTYQHRPGLKDHTLMIILEYPGILKQA